MFQTLSAIGTKLNENNIIWGVGASILMYQHGLLSNPHDINLIVDINDIEKADKILKRMGERKTYYKDTNYSTKYFYEYVINNIDVDVMAGLAINHNSGIFEYNFDCNSVSEFIEINDVSIPFTSLEDWYVIYQLIPGRESKVKMIEDYLLQSRLHNPDLLKRLLQENLPTKALDNKIIY